MPRVVFRGSSEIEAEDGGEMTQVVTGTGPLVVRMEVVNESDDDLYPDDREMELLSVDGSREKEGPGRLSDVEAFEEEWMSGWMEEWLFPDGLPKPPKKFEAVLRIAWIHTNTTCGEDWDAELVVEQWKGMEC